METDEQRIIFVLIAINDFPFSLGISSPEQENHTILLVGNGFDHSISKQFPTFVLM
jgi:hypothetical protein